MNGFFFFKNTPQQNVNMDPVGQIEMKRKNSATEYDILIRKQGCEKEI